MSDKQKNVKDITDAADAVNTIELKKLLEELRNSSKKNLYEIYKKRLVTLV